MCLLLNMLSKFVITFIPRSKHLLISWQQSLSTVILEPKKRKSVTVSIFSPSICHEVMRSDAMILVFWVLSFKPAFHSPLSPLSQGSLVLGSCQGFLIWGLGSPRMSFPLLYYSSQSGHRHSPDSQGGDTGSASGRGRGTRVPHREGGVE